MLKGIMDNLLKVSKEVETLQKSKLKKGERRVEDAVYVTVCPYGTRPCDEKNMENGMFKCPVDKAPNPIVIDKEGNVCYATVDLEAQLADAPKNVNTLFAQKANDIMSRINSLMFINPEFGQKVLQMFPQFL